MPPMSSDGAAGACMLPDVSPAPKLSYKFFCLSVPYCFSCAARCRTPPSFCAAPMLDGNCMVQKNTSVLHSCIPIICGAFLNCKSFIQICTAFFKASPYIPIRPYFASGAHVFYCTLTPESDPIRRPPHIKLLPGSLPLLLPARTDIQKHRCPFADAMLCRLPAIAAAKILK